MADHSAPWWKTGVIYQIYPRSFMDTNGDGVGDLAGIASRLGYLDWLGIDALWLSPIYPSPMADFGYDVADYSGVDPLFGSMDDFDALVHAAHERDMKVVMDFVPNHTSNEHPWFLESRSARDSAKRDWYLWRDAAADGEAPNNWLAYFGGQAWTFDDSSGQYYMHNFLPEQPDLNYHNPDVKQAVFDSLRFWLDRGIDGFRFDVIDRLLKDPQLQDNPPNPNFVAGRDNPTNAYLRLHSEAAPGIHDVIREFQGVVKSYDQRVSIGEIQYYADPTPMIPFYGDREEHEIDLPFNFGLILTPWQATAVRGFVDAYDAMVPPYGWPNYVLGNHDQHRLASRVGGEAQARVAAMLLLTLRGTPFIYNGDEIGMHNVEIPQHLVKDPQGINIPGYTRDVTRTPLQWNAGQYAGFSEAEPWLPLADDYETRNVEVEYADPSSILTLYHRLLAYRRTTTAMTLGGYRSVDVERDDCFVYLRERDQQRRLIALNFSAADHRLNLATGAEASTGRLVLSTRLDREEPVDLAHLSLRANEGIVIEL